MATEALEFLEHSLPSEPVTTAIAARLRVMQSLLVLLTSIALSEVGAGQVRLRLLLG